MKAQFRERSEVSCLSEFDPALILFSINKLAKLVLDLIPIYNLCRPADSISCVVIKGGVNKPMRRINKRMGQSMLEYAVLIVLVAAALLTIQIYLKRGIQGRLRSAADDIGEQFSPVGTLSIKTDSYSKTKETSNAGVTTSNIVSVGDSYTNRKETFNLKGANEETWGK